ncbi:hypothetical protein VTL71DRAFT_9278 [Oculimacula yallundae]|uniref:Uncharacterized protein n=1 Tax=Oculimacula yallundae TaxID=86028 RepID=A0ABR4BSK9_9HELO
MALAYSPIQYDITLFPNLTTVPDFPQFSQPCFPFPSPINSPSLIPYSTSPPSTLSPSHPILPNMYPRLKLEIPPFRPRIYGRNRQPRGLQRTRSYQDQLERRSVDILSDVSEASGLDSYLYPLHRSPGTSVSPSASQERSTTPANSPSNSPRIVTSENQPQEELRPVISHLSIGQPALDTPISFPAPFPERDTSPEQNTNTDAPREMEMSSRPNIPSITSAPSYVFAPNPRTPSPTDSGYDAHDDSPASYQGYPMCRCTARGIHGFDGFGGLTTMSDWSSVYDEDDPRYRVDYDEVEDAVDKGIDDENVSDPTIDGTGTEKRGYLRKMYRKMREKVESVKRFFRGNPEPPRRDGGWN